MHNRPEIFLPAYFPVSGINKIPIYLRTLSDRTGKWGMGGVERIKMLHAGAGERSIKERAFL